MKAKGITISVNGILANFVVLEEHMGTVLDGMLKKVFRTAKSQDVDWHVVAPPAPVKARVVSVWVKVLCKDFAVVVAKVVHNGKVRPVVHSGTFNKEDAYKVKDKIKVANVVDLNHWR